MRFRSSFLILLFLAGHLHAAEKRKPMRWSDKVDQAVFEGFTHEASGEMDFLVFLEEQPDLSGAAELSTKLEKGAFVYQQLTAVAARTQPAVLQTLRAAGAKCQPFWVANMIQVHGSLGAVQDAAERSEVARIYANPSVHFEPPVAEGKSGTEAPDAVESSLTLIKATDAWARGYTGQGVVVAGNDTGFRWTHNAVKARYRGWNGSSADHNYNWRDAIHSGGGSCGPNTVVPCDDQGHGTHTLGTMLGDDGGSNQVGVAPGAKWMACRCMDQGNGTPATYMECLQFFIAPTNLAGANPDPAKAPDVINNSWGCPTEEGCSVSSLQTAIENVRAAGIVVVVAAGNSGSGCSTVNDPPAIYEASFSVGATTLTDAIASFSSRGPVTLDGSGRLKPNVSAPGSGIRSSTRTSDSTYGSMSGTSMASPHVAGAVALVLSAHPELKGNVNAIETLLEQTAVHPPTSQTCGGVPGTAIPNNTFGWGRINVLDALGLDDTDGDGMLDWKEVLAGTDRTQPNSVLQIAGVEQSGDDAVISFPAVANRRYRLEQAAAPDAPSWNTVVDNITGSGSVQVTAPGAYATGPHFYRLRLLP